MNTRETTLVEKVKANLISFLIVFIIVFIAFLLSSRNVKVSLLFSGALTLIAISWVIINDYRGEKKHGAIHYSRLFQDLYRQGFKKEEIGCYKGVVKQINN